MNLFHQTRRLRVLFRRKKLDREVAEEMRFQLNQRTNDNLADGLPGCCCTVFRSGANPI